ncbi:PREDICTED: molybdenum cofactor sulfurase-like isoform X2 [Branchiostoma belcheri]|uniref:Molybdenum cofactor sulfurase n=1 Tax=Branchiostoma belcheri TaxID=7741 RepID=A0A6P4YGK5_BRABE|nr:PREDICTED: molybdenum cofactor sulfurase-like isoform X2 [Branchiostoma belcheri]
MADKWRNVEHRQRKKADFLNNYGKLYGYGGVIDKMQEQEFARLKGMVYLDHTGTTHYAQSQLESYMQDLQTHVYGNPHTRSASSRLTSDTIDQLRFRILQHFNTSVEHHSIIFTSGCTGTLRLLAESFPWEDGSIFSYLEDNHTSVLGVREVAAKERATIVCVSEEELLGCSNDKGNPQNRTVTAEKNNSKENCTPNSSVPNFSGTTHFFQESERPDSVNSCGHSHLFAYPAMCNFSGRKFPLEWCSKVKRKQFSLCERSEGKWFTCLDAASFVSTSPLNLSSCEADFVAISFYKVFGFPTGLGALIVRKDAEDSLKKTYFGGGTALAVTSNGRFYIPRPNLHDRFEDGTLPFLDIIALRHGFDTLENLTGMQYVSQHTFSLAQYVYLQLTSLKHHNGQPAAVVYTDTQFDDITTQGGIVNFNLLRANGNFVGYSEVDKLAALHDIHVRTGCFCNSGACRRHLGLSDEQLRQNYQAGHVCGDDKDLISGRPTGSVRISFGYMSTFEDAQFFLDFVQECFVEKSPKTTTSAGNAHNEQYRNTGLTSKLNVQNANEGLEVEHDKTETKRSATLQSSGLKNSSKNQADDPQESCRDSLKKDLVMEETSKRQDEKENSTENSEAKVPGQRHLTNIFLYPVKSCGAFEVKSWQLSARGLMYDREWMVVNESGVCLSQKREPKLCLIRPAIYLTEAVLQLSAEGMKPLNVPLTGAKMGDMEASMCQSKVCGDRITGLDCGNEAADWLTRFLGQPCRMVRQNPDSDRDCKVNRDGENSADGKFSLSLANESQYLLISRQSVRELQQQINSNSNMVIPTEDLVLRFRGNLVIDSGQPYEEDDWSELMIGQHQFQSRGRCSRCQMVCLDQATAERSKEPLMTLLRIRGKKVPFGIHLVHNMADTESCCIQVGDKVTPVTMATD